MIPQLIHVSRSGQHTTLMSDEYNLIVYALTELKSRRLEQAIDSSGTPRGVSAREDAKRIERVCDLLAG